LPKLVPNLIEPLCQDAYLLLQLIDACFQVGDLAPFAFELALYEFARLCLRHFLCDLELQELSVHAIQIIADDRQITIARASSQQQERQQSEAPPEEPPFNRIHDAILTQVGYMALNSTRRFIAHAASL
jgi:hypothetical protein